MDVKIKRLLLGIAAAAAAAVLLAGGAYAVTPDDSWMAAVDWEDAKQDEPEPTAAHTAVLPTTAPPAAALPATALSAPALPAAPLVTGAPPATVLSAAALPATAFSAKVLAATAQPPPGDAQIVVSGKKTWKHGVNPAAKRPDSITLLVLADGAIVIRRRITSDDHWAWSFRLPKYGLDGREIAYTVNEARFADYVKAVDGYSLTNIYMPGRNTDEPYPPGASGPKTDDGSHPAFWAAMMGVSLLGLALAVVLPRRKRR